jgi:hypothetical protein
MELDRGTLARVDRKLLAGLDQDETFVMVRVPVTRAKWSTWKRYCDAAGISMGRAIVSLINRELVSVFGESAGDQIPVFEERAHAELTAREVGVAARERKVESSEERLHRWAERLRLAERELETRELEAQLASRLASRPTVEIVKPGRNERCPCGSGLKYKHCHGLGDRLTSSQ